MSSVGIEPPFFSVVVPVWNRAGSVRRCLDSVLSQRFEDYEVIAVDDGSVDGSWDVLASCRHDRLRTIRRERNGGTWAARSEGVWAAHGAWIILLDSDDALVPGALELLSRRALVLAPAVGVLGASYRDSDGRIWPDPPPPDGPMGVERFLAWRDVVVRSDFLAVYRRQVFRTVPPPSGFETGALFELEVFRSWQKLVIPDVCGVVNLDAPNRQTGRGRSFSVESFLARAEAWARVDDEVLSRYGALLREHAPHFFVQLLGHAGLYSLAARHRLRGAARMAAYLRRRPLSLGAWVFLVSGLIGCRQLGLARKLLG